MPIWLSALLVLVRSFALRKRKSTNNLSIVYKSMISNNTSIMAEAIRPELICFVVNMLTKTTMEKFEKLLITPMK